MASSNAMLQLDKASSKVDANPMLMMKDVFDSIDIYFELLRKKLA